MPQQSRSTFAARALQWAWWSLVGMLEPSRTCLFLVHLKAALPAHPCLVALSHRCRCTSLVSWEFCPPHGQPLGQLTSRLILSKDEQLSGWSSCQRRRYRQSSFYHFRVGLIIFHFSKRQGFPIAPAVCVWWNKDLLGSFSLQVKAITHGTGVLSSESFYISQIYGHVCK